MRTILSIALALLVTAPATAPVAAQTASLVRDIATGEGPSGARGTYFEDLTPVQGKIFFMARRFPRDSKGDLWVTDGTPQGTRLVLATCQELGECSVDADIVGSVGGVAFLSTQLHIGEFINHLWRSDGTREGTFLLDPEGSTTTYQLLFFKGVLFFAACGNEDCALWKTDGSRAGTVRVSVAPAGHFLGALGVLGGRLLFITGSNDDEVWLWSSDGTPAGTARVRALDAVPQTVQVAGTRLFFTTWDESTAPRLWVTDGTAAGTRAVRDFPAGGSFPGELVAAGGRVYFRATEGSSGEELWTSDGTAAGTYNATAMGPDNPNFSELTAVGDRVIFKAQDGLHGVRIWASGGGRAASVPLTDLCPECDYTAGTEIVPAGGRAFFVTDDAEHGVEPWVTDGTAAGTHLVADLCPGRCSSTDPHDTRWLAIPGGALFVADDGAHGPQIWRTDGTTAGTVRWTSVDGSPRLLDGRAGAAFLGSRLFFGIGSEAAGTALWVSDKPAASRLLTVIEPQGPSSYPRDLFALGDRLLFSVFPDAPRGGDLWSSQGTPETTQAIARPYIRLGESIEPTRVGSLVFLRVGGIGEGPVWRTDGTAAGTLQLTGDVSRPGITAWQGKLFFGAGSQIWQSDGTEAGTVKVLDVPEAGVGVSHLAGLGPELYFLGSPGGGGFAEQLWRTDGTPAGTRKLVDDEVFGDKDPQLTRFGPAVFFTTFLGDLWRTDGTPEGTMALGPKEVSRLTVFQGALYFSARAGQHHVLWRSDGTPGGTAPVTEAVGNVSTSLVEYQGRLWFVGDDGIHGRELWSTDGTAAGTVLASDILPGAGSSDPGGFTVAGGRLFFAADDGVHGVELWQSDGTAAGTRLVQDVAPFGASSSPEQLTVAGDRLYFEASDGPSGRELWSLPLSQPACQASSSALCLSGGRFRVEARWRDFQGNTGMGQAVALTGDTGYFWFFDPANAEVVLKVLDGRGTNDHFWVFYGALSSVEYILTVTDTQTGVTRQYINPSGQLSSLGDTNGFGPLGAAKSRQASLMAPPSPLPLVATRTEAAAATGSCQAGPQRLCLNGGRFAVEVAWKDFGGRNGQGTAVSLAGSGDTGWFWFFDPANLELMVKVLDGTGVNGKHWVFYGALSSVEYTLTVTDTQTGEVRTYRNPAGRLASAADTGAF